MLKRFSRNFYKYVYSKDIYDEPLKSFFGLVKENLVDCNSEKILDAACGFNNEYLAKLIDDGLIETSSLTGLDIDENVIDANKIHKDIHIQDLHSPMGDNLFDGVISLYTWEHLENPAKVMFNFHRSLKKGGRLIIIAPNRYCYISIVERMLPPILKNLSWKILKGRKHMPYPAFFNLCTKVSLEQEAKRVGFDLKHYKAHDSAPIWFAKIPPLFMLMCLVMSTLNRFEIFEGMRGTFVAVLVKQDI